MLEPILKGLVEWLYEMMVDIMSYASGELLGVMSMDLSYFERTAPVISEIVNVFIALGWALLIGNMVFQLLKSIMSGVGFEAEDPKIIFLRTFVFSFLLLASRQICDICSGITGTVIELLQMPTAITVTTPDESMFSLGSGAKWLLVIIVGVVLMVQMVKLLFEIGERYVITSVLTFFAPLAFSMGGSRNTNDIFKGWCRMYGSMLVMMIMNIVFLKLIMSAMSQMAAGGVLIWLVFVVALTRVARKIDSHIGKIGLNPAQTGSGIGSRLPGMMTMMAVKVMSSTVSRSLAGAKGNSGKNGSSGSRQRRADRAGFGHRSTGTASDGISNRYGGNTSSGGTSSVYNGSATVNGSNVTGASSTSNNPSNTSVMSQNAEKTAVANRPGFGSGNQMPNRAGTTSPQNVINKSSQSENRNVNPSYNGETHKPSANRPTMPRNVSRDVYGGTNNMGVNGHSSERHDAVSKESTSGTVGKTTAPHRNGSMPPPPIIQNGQKTPQSSVNVTKSSGGASANVSKNAQNNLHTNGNATKNAQSMGGNVNSVNVGGNAGGTNVSGIYQNFAENSHSEYSGKEHFAKELTERDREQQRSSSEYYNSDRRNTSETTERRVNHEYKHGRYNPAAANKKAKKSYYQKENFRNDKIKRRGEENRKRKR